MKYVGSLLPRVNKERRGSLIQPCRNRKERKGGGERWRERETEREKEEEKDI